MDFCSSRDFGIKFEVMFKYFVFDLSSERYIPVPGIHGADYAKQLAPCDVFIKIPFFNYFALGFTGFNVERLKASRDVFLSNLGVR